MVFTSLDKHTLRCIPLIILCITINYNILQYFIIIVALFYMALYYSISLMKFIHYKLHCLSLLMYSSRTFFYRCCFEIYNIVSSLFQFTADRWLEFRMVCPFTINRFKPELRLQIMKMYFEYRGSVTQTYRVPRPFCGMHNLPAYFILRIFWPPSAFLYSKSVQLPNWQNFFTEWFKIGRNTREPITRVFNSLVGQSERNVIICVNAR